MASINRVYAARLARMQVLGPMGESLGRVRDVVVSISIVRQQPRVLGLVVEMASRRRIFVPILRVSAIEPNAVTLNTNNVSMLRFEQRPGEVLVLGQIIDTKVRVNDPELPELADTDVVVTDLGLEQTRTRDWMVTRVSVRVPRRLGRRSTTHIVGWRNVQGLTPSALAMPGQAVAQLLHQFEKWRPIEVADAVRELPAKRRYEVIAALDNDRLADILQELPEDEQAELLMQLGDERAADVLEEMDPDDAADLLGTMTPTLAERLLRQMDPEDSDPVRRLLKHSPDTAGGLMTSEPVVLTPDTSVAEALARVRDPDLTPALSSLVLVVRPPTATPTGQYLGCVAPAAAAARTAVHAGRRDRRRRPALARARHVAGHADPLLRRLQPGLRSGRRCAASSAGRGDRGRRARPSAAARLARYHRRTRAGHRGGAP